MDKYFFLIYDKNSLITNGPGILSPLTLITQNRSEIIFRAILKMGGVWPRAVNLRLDKLGRAGPGRFLPILCEDFADIPPFF